MTAYTTSYRLFGDEPAVGLGNQSADPTACRRCPRCLGLPLAPPVHITLHLSAETGVQNPLCSDRDHKTLSMKYCLLRLDWDLVYVPEKAE